MRAFEMSFKVTPVFRGPGKEVNLTRWENADPLKSERIMVDECLCPEAIIMHGRAG